MNLRRSAIDSVVWQEEAACADQPTSIFFPSPAGDNDPPEALAERAKQVCRRCPVRRQCLAFAFEIGDYDAILGGTTGRERVRMVRGGRRVA